MSYAESAPTLPRCWVGDDSSAERRRISPESRRTASANEEVQWLAVKSGELRKLDSIDPALPALTFGDEGPWLAQVADNLNLGGVSVHTSLPQPL